MATFSAGYTLPRARHAVPQTGGDARQRRKRGAKRSVGNASGGAAEPEPGQGQPAPKVRAMDLRIRLGGDDDDDAAPGDATRAWGVPARDAALDAQLQRVYANAARLLRDQAARHAAAHALQRQRATARWLAGLNDAERGIYVHRNEAPTGTKHTERTHSP